MFSSDRDAVTLKNWEPFSWPNVNREWGEEADLWNSPGEGGLGTPREPIELLLGRVNLTRDSKGGKRISLFKTKCRKDFEKLKTSPRSQYNH